MTPNQTIDNKERTSPICGNSYDFNGGKNMSENNSPEKIFDKNEKILDISPINKKSENVVDSNINIEKKVIFNLKYLLG